MYNIKNKRNENNWFNKFQCSQCSLRCKIPLKEKATHIPQNPLNSVPPLSLLSLTNGRVLKAWRVNECV